MGLLAPVECQKGSHHFTNMMQLSCGDQMYAKVWKPNNMFLLDINTGVSNQVQWGPANNTPHTAEFIVERGLNHLVRPTRPLRLAKFGSVTFYGVGITYGGQYLGMNQVPHDFSHMYHCSQFDAAGNCTGPDFAGPPTRRQSRRNSRTPTPFSAIRAIRPAISTR
jgi:hypothetical protein